MGKTNSELKFFKKFILKFWPILVIVFLVAIFAFPYWAKNRVPFPADYLVDAFPPWQYFYALPVKNNAMPDVISQMFPFKHLVIDFFKRGDLPLWNPYNFSGNPLLANYQSAVFHPANFLFFIIPEADAWSLMILLQPLLAGLFTYLFCRQLSLSRAASLLSSVAFMFCGFITVWMAYGTMSWALLWLPFVLYLIEKNFQKTTGLNLALISLSLAASFFSGHFQISFYVVLATVAYLFYRLTNNWQFKTFLICFLFIILGILLAMIQILPTLELYQLSVRGKVVGISEIIPWRYLVTILAPDFYGNPVTRNDWFGHYAEWSGFTGVIPLILAFFAFLGKRRKAIWFFGILALGALILTRQTPLLDLILKWKIPVLSSSAASRIIGLFSFSIAVLAGFGFDQLKESFNSPKIKLPFLFLFLIIILFLGIWGWLLLIRPFPIEKLIIAKRNFILPTIMAFTFVGLLMFYKLFQEKMKNNNKSLKKVKVLVLLLILLLTSFDLLRFAKKWMPFDSRQHLYPKLPILEFLTKTVGFNRLFGFFGMEVQNYFKIQGFNGYDPLYIQRYGELLMAARHGQIELPSTRGVGLERRAKYTERLVNLLGGKYFLHALADKQECWEFDFWNYPGQFRLIYQDEQYEVYENKKALPRAFLAYDYYLEKDPQEIVDKIFNPQTDLKRTLILEENPGLEILKLKAGDKEGKAEIVEYLPNKIKIEVETKKPGLLFLSDNYYPGWKALVDGKETKIYRADYAFRAVMIPIGTHEVEFIYQPESFRKGSQISLLSLGLVVVLGLILRKRK